MTSNYPYIIAMIAAGVVSLAILYWPEAPK